MPFTVSDGQPVWCANSGWQAPQATPSPPSPANSTGGQATLERRRSRAGTANMLVKAGGRTVQAACSVASASGRPPARAMARGRHRAESSYTDRITSRR